MVFIDVKDNVRTYTLGEIRAAFLMTFHKKGELFFDYYSGSEKEDTASTNGYWDDFLESLEKIDEKKDNTFG